MKKDFTTHWQQVVAAAVQNAETDWAATEKLSERWLVLLLALADEWQRDRGRWLQRWPSDFSAIKKLPEYLPAIAHSCTWLVALTVPVKQQRPWHVMTLKGLLLYLIWQWQRDDTPDLSKSMAAMDRSLRWLEKLQNDFT